jgi:ubiquinone/menaquinone biosynthesis C-methylase UbiE
MILNQYYEKVYEKYLFSPSIQSLGISYFERAVERVWREKNINSTLELGSGQGEHLKYVIDAPLKEYICVDLREFQSDEVLEDLTPQLRNVLRFFKCNVEELPFNNERFDRTLSTCLLHHLDDPMAAMMEARRVTRPGGEIAFAMPTDPGIFNHLVKRLISVRQMRKFTNQDPWLIYALEHKNHISGLIKPLELVFAKDNITFHYMPFRIKSWNLNLICVAHIKRSKSPLYLYTEGSGQHE